MAQNYRERVATGKKPSFFWFESDTWDALQRLVAKWGLRFPRDAIARAIDEADKREKRRDRIAKGRHGDRPKA